MSQISRTNSDPKSRRKNRLLWAAALVYATVMLGVAPRSLAALQAPGGQSGGQISNLERAVRERTQQFYTLLQAGQTAKAEEYVMKAGRERFRAQPNAPFLAFKIISADVEPDGKGANVVVEMSVLSTFMGGIMPYQRTLQWQLEDGEWRLEMPEAAVGMDSTMGVSKGMDPSADKPEELKFQAHIFGLGLVNPGEHKEVRFPFTNASNHIVKIKQIATGCDCLKVKTQQMEYKPGESGELVIDFDSANYESGYSQTMVVRTDPGGIASYLLVHGTVVSKEIFEGQKKAKSQQNASPQDTQPDRPPNARRPTSGQ